MIRLAHKLLLAKLELQEDVTGKQGLLEHNGFAEILVRGAVAGQRCGDVLPPAVLARKDKMGFPVPLHLWMRNGLGDFVRGILTSRACRERGLFRADRVDQLIEGEEPFGRRLWGLLNLEMWFRTFIDAPGEGTASGRPGCPPPESR